MPTLIYRFENREQRVELGARTAIGRLKDNDLCIPCESMSSHHALITREGDAFQLSDQGSSNGIIVDNRRVSSLLLRDRAAFSLGDVDFVFVAGDGAGESTAHQGQSLPAPETPPPPAAEESPPASETLPPPDTPPAPPGPETPSARVAGPEEVIARFKKAREEILAEIGKVIIGQRETLHQMLAALFARGHCLLIGVPGLAKTLMVKTLGNTVDLQSNRIQFTPDLMPSDITGTDILEEDSLTGKRNFRFHRGPLFTNLLLADEINRTPPKTQAALLEAMQEHRVTVSGSGYDLPEPFMVLATQNPIEQEGTYPLPEAQLDRFMFCIHLSYPSAAEEQQVILDTTRDLQAPVSRVLKAPEVLELQRLVRQVPVSQHVALYALSLVRATRPNLEGAQDFVNRWVRWGAGTRAGQYLLLAAKAHVLLQGRFSVSCADVREYALPVLRHRIFPNFTAASEGVSTDAIVKKIVETVKEPKY
jgi:MoxR-like ATPase